MVSANLKSKRIEITFIPEREGRLYFKRISLVVPALVSVEKWSDVG